MSRHLLLISLPLLVALAGCSENRSRSYATSSAAVSSASSPARVGSNTTAPASSTTVPVVGPSAQGRGGIYGVRGTDPVHGAYTGRIELRWQAPGDYAYVREVEFTTLRHQGRAVSLVWSGSARDTAQGGVQVTLSLDRMGWALDGAGQITRTPTDGTPMTVNGDFQQASPNGFSGQYIGQGTPFQDPSESWTYQAPPGPDPIWESERVVRPSHSAPSSTIKTILFALFNSFHQLPYIQPFVPRPEFQAAIYGFTYDRTDFALHQQRADLVRLINTLVDPLNLAEAAVKANAFGRKLRTKGEGADQEVPQSYLNPTGCLSKVAPSGAFVEENDGALWTGVYTYSQALRYRTTQEPAARANVERTGRALWTMMAISGRTDEFARTLRAAGSLPLGTKWAAGSGPFAGTEWKRGGNNDMYKGLLWGGLAITETLPAGSALRTDYGQALRGLNRDHSVTKGTQRVGNRLISNGTVAALLGPGPERDAYRRGVRNPLLALFNLAMGGGFHYKGISDWSGTHLNISGLMLEARLAELHNNTLAKQVTKLALRRAAKSGMKTRRSIHILAGAAMGTVSYATPIDPSDGIWALRELPFPRSYLGSGQFLKADYCAGPYPNLPWKRDWTTDRGRARGILAPPLFEWAPTSYVWKDAPYPAVFGGNAAATRTHSVDYLFAYWIARAHGIVGPND